MPEKHSHEWDKEFHYSSCEKDCRCCKALHGVSDDSCKICNKYYKNKKHRKPWNKEEHYGQCDQSCPCCRSIFHEAFGSCVICNNQRKL